MNRAWLAAALMFAVAIAESVMGIVGARSSASEADWKAASDQVRSGFKEGDLIVFAPAWIDPVGRQHLGDKMPVDMVARPDADRYARIWEVSVRGAHAEETAGLSAVDEQRFGKVTVRRYEKPAKKLVYDFTAHAAEARCSVDQDPRPCTAAHVEPRVLEIDYRPRRGLLVPLGTTQTVAVEYEDVPGGMLVGYVGLHDYYARKNGDGVVTFRARVDETQSVLVPVRNPKQDGEGWQRFELELGPGTHHVRFELSTDKPAHRLPGFHAEVRSP